MFKKLLSRALSGMENASSFPEPARASWEQAASPQADALSHVDALPSLVAHVLMAIGEWKREQGLEMLPDSVVFQQALAALNALDCSRVELSRGGGAQ